MVLRANTIDAGAFRLFCEYKRLTDLLIFIEGDEVEGHLEDVADYHEKIARFETMKSMNAYHLKAMETLTETIKQAIIKIKGINTAPPINVVELK
jgi:hypothetical protein